MSESQYVFTDARYAEELERLQAIERVFDPATQKRIEATGIAAGWRCLEVGAGAGSITQWMAAIVGDTGQIVVIDLDTRFVASLESSNTEILKADIRHLPLQNHFFDLIHARYVLIHLPDFEVALMRMLDLLKPGGWLVLEEPDFAAARAIVGEDRVCLSADRVNCAILKMFEQRGMQGDLGARLPALLRKHGIQQLTVENDAPLSCGGSGIAIVMKKSAMQLADKYIATGAATQEDIEQYCQFAEDPETWGIYYATVGIIARKSPGTTEP
ncbi:class I SAM-dependent methyltransferase [Leptolyngbya ohadii]|uniref:class I SAM-dependent methyltransferase n=1 Tax=Leptolyngbya ohadii TaxID=1962290 RepID=UPI000B599A5E|nr:methyltransferase domain-containing protein [Leptolyngbya ohadii]